MEVQAIGQLVPEILKTNQPIYFHSQFQHGMNLQIENELLYIGDDQKGITPFGIHLSKESYQIFASIVNVEEDAVVFFPSEHKLVIGCQELPLSSKNICKDEIIARSFEPNRPFLMNGPTELPETGLNFTAELENLHHWSEVIQRLVGRGKGLTPAGDDFLVGILALNQQFSFLPTSFFTCLDHLLTEGITTDVSIGYLRAALKGFFSTAIVDVLNSSGSAEQRMAIKRLLEVGSTSGRDTLAGIIWGYERVKKQLGF